MSNATLNDPMVPSCSLDRAKQQADRYVMRRTIISLGCSVSALILGANHHPQTYGAACPAPNRGWGTEKDGIGHLMGVIDVSMNADGLVFWNRAKVSDQELNDLMHRAGQLDPTPMVVLDVSPAAPCRRVERVRAIMGAAPICSSNGARCSEGRNVRHWRRVGGP
jgi:hypothetical protein